MLVEPFAVHLRANGLTLLGSQQPSPDEKFADFELLIDYKTHQVDDQAQLQTLARGYAVVRDGGDIVTSVAEAKAAKFLEIEFQDGRNTNG